MLKRLVPRRSASRWLGSQVELELERHFTVEKRLGSGSFAVVYRVRRHADGQAYALKVADVQSLDALSQADVVNEIRLLASLSHPNLTTFYEAFCDHGKLCIVQELVGGGDMGSAIRRRAGAQPVPQHFTEEQVWATLLQVGLGLQHLHHAHIMHRDLKPANILVTEGGLVKLADLGISATLDRVFERTMIGTPHYMPPEMWRRQPYSYSADIWALGCLAWELCALRPLFLGANDAETRQKVLAGAVPPLPARYSPALRAAVGGMLQASPAARPTIDDLLLSPAAQKHLALLPPELQRCWQAPGLSGARGELRPPLPVPRAARGWDELNAALPTPRYSSGGGVSSALLKKKSWSTGDLQGLAATAGAAGDLSAAAHSHAAPAATAAAGMRKAQSHGSLSAAVELELERSSSSLRRRRSISVGEQLLPGSAPRDGSPSGLARARRRASYASSLGAVEEEAGSAPGSSPGGGSLAGGSPPPAGPHPALWERGGGGGSGQGRAAARDVRSRSLSVEDTLEMLASRQQQLPLPPNFGAASPLKPTSVAVAAPPAAPAAPASAAAAPAPAAPVVPPAQAAGASAAGAPSPQQTAPPAAAWVEQEAAPAGLQAQQQQQQQKHASWWRKLRRGGKR